MIELQQIFRQVVNSKDHKQPIYTPVTKRGGSTMGLVVEHINKSFGQFQAIKDLSMEVKEGAIFGFLGANGAGKTTTMRMILDILRPDSGSAPRDGRGGRRGAGG